jgi:quercetin dioxygenase-like cupin family protein
MDTQAFEAQLRRDGYLEVRHRSMERGVDTTPHSHPFDTRLLLLEGELTVVRDGRADICRAGEVIEIARGAEHFERYGPTRVVLVAGLRHPDVDAAGGAPA